MHDTLDYVSEDPIYRRWHHNKLTFGLLYAFSENFVLPISHDEVVHGKRSVVGKMPGDEWQRFANARAFYGFMWGHPGKKLLFMGQEFGQTNEWNASESLPWWLLDYWPHQGVQAWIRDLNRLYRETPALYARDCEPDGFRWIVVNDETPVGAGLSAAGRAERSAGCGRLQFHPGAAPGLPSSACPTWVSGARRSTATPAPTAAPIWAISAASLLKRNPRTAFPPRRL